MNGGGVLWTLATVLAAVMVVALGWQFGVLPAIIVWTVLTLALLIFLPYR